MNTREIIRRLESAGFVNQGGTRHDKLVHPDGRKTIVFRHRGDLPLGTVRAIEKQSGVSMR